MSTAVSINLNQLILGRELHFPIYDAHGVLLIAAGSAVTSELKQRLVARGVQTVIVDEADVSQLTLGHDSEETTAFVGESDEELDKRLDDFIRSGSFNVANTGPSLRKKVVQHGRKSYDSDRRQHLLQQQKEISESVEKLMQLVQRSEDVDGGGLNDVAEIFIENLTADISQTLSVGFLGDSDSNLAQHSISVAVLGMAIGIEMGLDAGNVRLIGITGLVQDLGMAEVPEEITEAHRPLTPNEFLEIQKHPIWTQNILERMGGIPRPVQLAAYQCHERPDGSGYPRGRDRTNIHLFARIIHVADSYTAMTSPRPYRPPMMAYAAMENLLRQSQRWQADPMVVRSLLHVLSLFPIGSYVTLTDGSAARVIRSNATKFTQPIVVRVQDAEGNSVDADDDCNLIDLSSSDLGIVQALPTPGRVETRTDYKEADLNRLSSGARNRPDRRDDQLALASDKRI